ncbi:hypothetical protein NZK35_20910 [Stieleria sp. ICT_E10.1]|uniref:hypothetical protein n=1 Tax=Stieleria sedimenti TaxID=2976331 RepID=UPI00218018BE|nr:hypothetical protein [Stieleria sedimenti]MCS7469121.1 hypothetical protein [Stieleria sedimenti]
MRSFQLQIWRGRRLTNVGRAWLAFCTLAIFAATVQVASLLSELWLTLATGAGIVAFGVAVFVGGCWISDRCGFASTEEDAEELLRKKLVEQCDELIESVEKVISLLEPCIEIEGEEDAYFVQCRNIERDYFPKSCIELIRPNGLDPARLQVGPFRSQSEAERLKGQILESLPVKPG